MRCQMDKIAIIGMGCLFPDYSDKEKFWHTIVNGGNFLRQDRFLDKTLERGGVSFSGTGFFSERMCAKELEEFKLYGELYKWYAYIVDEALKDAGYTNNTAMLKRTGLIVGVVGQTTRDQIDFLGGFVTKNLEKKINSIVGGNQFKYTFIPQSENLKPESMLADTQPIQYLAQKRGFGGPVVSFNAACASPLYALRMAMSYLNAGEADMIIAGSQCYNETIGGIYGLFNKFGILSDIGESMPLDKNSKGLIPGSGAGVFALKRLTDAEQDGDNILAVIESIGWSNDGGSSSGIMTPSAIGQYEAYESAYKGGVSRDIDYIECHATGTIAGDQVEIETIERFFGFDYSNDTGPIKGRPLLGGLKGSTGHFFTATACASIVKVILAMQHEVIPATIQVNNPICSGLVLENTPWKAGKKLRRAGVNAFGFGGINAHLVISEYRPKTKTLAETLNEKIDYSETELAITGMGLKIGSFESVEDFLQGLQNSKTAFTEPDENRFRGYNNENQHMLAHGFDKLPKGAYISSFQFDAMRFKMPITGNPFFLRRDMLLLETVSEALDFAGIKKGEAPRTAVIVHSAPDYTDPIFMATFEIDESIRASLEKSYPELTPQQRYEILNIMREDEAERERVGNVPGMIVNIRGNRISAHWGFMGPSFTVFESEVSIFRCLELARFFIAEKIVDQVVIGVSSFSGEFEHLFVQKELGNMGLMLEHGIAEGAVALVVKSKDMAIENNDTIYSIVKGVAISHQSLDKNVEIKAALNKALRQGKLDKKEIGLIEIPSTYSDEYKNLIKNVCKDEYGEYFSDQLLSLNIEDYLGFGFSLSAAASIVRHSLQLYFSRIFIYDSNEKQQQYNWSTDKHSSLITGYTRDGHFGCALMTAYLTNESVCEDKTFSSRLVPFPIPFDSKADLLKNLLQMQKSVATNKALKQLYTESWAKYKAHKDTPTTGLYRAALLLSDSKDALKREINNLIYRVENGLYFLERHADADTFCIESITKDESIRDSLIKLSARFGLSTELAGCLRLEEALVRYNPVKYLLTIGAKLMFEGIPFDYEKFFGNFEFYILKQPSFILDISTGMPEFSRRVDTEENRHVLSAIREQLSKSPVNLIPSIAIPKFNVFRYQQTDINLDDFYKNISSPEMRLIDEILLMDGLQRYHGIGKVIAKLNIESDHPIFESDLQQRVTLTESLLNEAINQLQALYAIKAGYLADGTYRIANGKGLLTYMEPIKFMPSTLRYELHNKSISEHAGKTVIRSDCDVYQQDTCICNVRYKAFTIERVTEMREKKDENFIYQPNRNT